MVGDRIVVDRAGLTNYTIRFWARAFAPGRARLVDARRVAG